MPKQQKIAKTAEEIEYEFEKKCKFFLVYWLPETEGGRGQVQVLKRCVIPAYARNKGKQVQLYYLDPEIKGSKKRLLSARIVQGGDDIEALYAIELNAFTGCLLTEDEKRFHPAVLARKVACAKLKKIDTAASKVALKEDSRNLLAAQSIIKAHQPPPQVIAPSSSVSDPHQPGTSAAENHQSTPAPDFDHQRPELSHDGIANLYAEAVSHHLSLENLTLLETFHRTVKENIDSAPNSVWLCDVLQSVFDILAKKRATFVKKLRLPTEWFVAGDDRVDLFGDKRVFLPPHTYTLVTLDVDEQDMTWEKYVSQVLGTLYGNNLAYLTVLGTGGAIGIAKALLVGLFDFCQKKFNALKGPDAHKEYNRHILNLISNRKKMNKRTDSKITQRLNGVTHTATAKVPRMGASPANDSPANALAAGPQNGDMLGSADHEVHELERSDSLERGDFGDRIISIVKEPDANHVRHAQQQGPGNGPNDNFVDRFLKSEDSQGVTYTQLETVPKPLVPHLPEQRESPSYSSPAGQNYSNGYMSTMTTPISHRQSGFLSTAGQNQNQQSSCPPQDQNAPYYENSPSLSMLSGDILHRLQSLETAMRYQQHLQNN